MSVVDTGTGRWTHVAGMARSFGWRRWLALVVVALVAVVWGVLAPSAVPWVVAGTMGLLALGLCGLDLLALFRFILPQLALQ